MKKLLILLVSFTLVAGACNNKAKTSDAEKTTTTDKDTKDEKKDSDNKGDDNNNDDSRNSSNNNNDGWSARDINDFVTSCVNSASDGGMARSAAQRYCDCMQRELEKRYPDPVDAARIDIESPDMQQLVKDCLN
jgi:hypothetical protein